MLRYNPADDDLWYGEEYSDDNDGFGADDFESADDAAAQWLAENYPERVEEVESTSGKKLSLAKKKIVFPDDNEVIQLVLDLEEKFSQDERLLELALSRPSTPEGRSERLRQINLLLGKSKKFAQLMALYEPFVDAPIVKEIYRIGLGKGEPGRTARILQQSGDFPEVVMQLRAETFVALASAIARGTFTQTREAPSRYSGQYYEAEVEDIPKRIRTWIYSTAKNRLLKWMDRRVRAAKVGLSGEFLEGEGIEKIQAETFSGGVEQEEQFALQDAQRRIDAFSVGQARKIKNANIPALLQDMTEDQKDVLQLRVAGFSYEEIAQSTGIPRGTVGRLLKEVREIVEESAGIRLSQKISEQDLLAAAESGVATLEDVRVLVGVEAENQLVNDLLSVLSKDQAKTLLELVKAQMQGEAEIKVENAFRRLSTTYAKFEKASPEEQRRLLELLPSQGVTAKVGAHASGRIEASEVKAVLREKVLDAMRRGRRGRPPRKNDGGIDYLIYQALAAYPMLIVETPSDVHYALEEGMIDEDQARDCFRLFNRVR